MIPGWGGCTLAPAAGPGEDAGAIVANPLNQNRMIDGPKAFELGLADRLFDRVEFLDESLRFLIDIIEGKVPVERKPPDTSKLKSQFGRCSDS